MPGSLAEMLRERRALLSEHLKALETQAAQVRGGLMEIDYLLQQWQEAQDTRDAADSSAGEDHAQDPDA